MNHKMVKNESKSLVGFLDKFSTGGTLGFLLVIGIIYALLLRTHLPFLSLNSLLSQITNLPNQEQLIAVVILPFYLATIVFGGSLLGALAGHWLHLFVKNLIEKSLSS